MVKTYSMEVAGRTLTLETGRMAGLANGSVLVRYGDTVVIVNVTASKSPREGIDFFPLSVDYEERLYSVGRIPGSFTKREGKPADKAILVGRAIDRPIRPLFPKDLRNDVCVNAMVLCVDPDCSPEVAAQIGTSAALSISDIPFNGPTAAVSVGYVDGEIVINPTLEQRERNKLNLTVAGTKDKVSMIEAGADQIPEDLMLQAIERGHQEIARIAEFIENIQKEIGKEKFTYESADVDHDFYEELSAFAKDKMYNALQAVDKEERESNLEKLNQEIADYFVEKYGEDFDAKAMKLADAIYKLEKKTVRYMILEEQKRVDGRGIDEIRPLSAEVDILPRTHGSALFSRGQTQVLSVVTLGTVADEQELDGLDEETSKRYIHHYNFPPYSVGEARPSRGPGRREIGHGALAERALVPVIPSQEEFPYTIRVVSEVLSSNGSTSQGSICGSTLSLMAAGVPIKEPVAGISTGLVTDENDRNRYVMITDIQGIEDFFGDMDFKVAGTKNGITAIQVDIKIDGLTMDIIKQAFERTKNARMYILDNIMLKAIPAPREEISKYAPKILTMSINPDKIKDVIGSGGKTINKIIAETGAKIDIEDDGRVFIAAEDTEAADRAVKMIKDITMELELGQTYTGKVVRIMNFGAFVEVVPGKEGMIHISKLAKERVEKVEDVVKVGDTVTVKVIEIDEQGRVNMMRIVE
ncbi:MAG: polyribonucleotide nucleotidyltransferase [Clostridia bacterium]|nr:polyribonucleotide nucleotidyltransferase [Clostridia bacterium]